MLALSQVSRYYRFLDVIMDRYTTAGEQLRDATREQMLAVESGASFIPQLQLDKQIHLGILVHLEIESFYIFAKIFLAKVALFLERYFGQLRNARLLSHAKLAKHIEAYAEQKQLAVDGALLRQIATLETVICNYRDKQISHHYNLRTIHATSWQSEGGVKISSIAFYPKPTDTQNSSDDLICLFRDIEQYVNLILSLVAENRARTALQLKSSTQHPES